MRGLDIVLCGEPHVRYNGARWPFRVSPAAWALLALLTANEHPIPREHLAATLWPEHERADGLANLRRHLYMLTNALPPGSPPWISGTSKAVAWNHASDARIDALEFERLLAGGRDGEAVKAYGGDLLPTSFDDAIVAARERLRGAYLDALERLTRESRASRDYAKTLDYAQMLLAADEWNEEAVREWMAAKYELGDGSAALAMYERLARRVRDEFSAAPMPQTTALRDAIAAGSTLPKTTDSVRPAPASDAGHQWKHPFVGRSESLEKLVALWSRAARGSGGVAFVSGEAGIGKSRLTAEFASVARARGGRVLAGTTSNPESAPYEAIVSALRSGIDADITAIGDGWLASLARVIPEVQSLRDGPAPADDGSSEDARDRLFEAIVRTLDYLGRKQPVCLVLEDVHWSGPGTVDLIAAIAGRVGTLPVSIAVTYRSEKRNASDGVSGLQARLVAERRAIACPLEPLRCDDVGALVAASVEGASAELCESVARASDGNPLFVAQLVANYLETGSQPAQTPGGVREAIAARLRLLDATVRAVAETAAAIGESFSADLLATAGGWDEPLVLDSLATLIDRAIVRESSGTLEYAFAHALFAAILDSSSPPVQRAARHRRIAIVLEREGETDSGAAVSIAGHWEIAGDAARAARAYVEAAQRAYSVFAYDEALTFCSHALELDARRDVLRAVLLVRETVHANRAQRDEQRSDLAALQSIADEDASDGFTWDVLRRKVLLARATDDLEREEELLRALNAAAMRANDPRWIAEAKKLDAARAFAVNENERARRLASEAAQMFEAIADRGGEREALCLLARMEADSGDLPAAQRFLERVRARTQTHDRIGLLDATMAAAYAANSQQHFAATRTLAATAVDLSRELGYKAREGDAHNLAGIALTRLGEFSSARKAIGLAHALFTSIGRNFGVMAASINLGVLEWRIGHLEAAYQSTLAARALLLELQNLGGRIVACKNLAGIGTSLGRYDDAIDFAREALSLSRAMNQPANEAGALLSLGYAQRCKGDVEGAVANLKAALAIHRGVDRPVDILETLAELSLAYAASGDDVAALSCVEELLAAPEAAFETALWPQLYHWVAARVYHHCADDARALGELRSAVAAMERLSAQIDEPDAGMFARIPLNLAISRASRDAVWPELA